MKLRNKKDYKQLKGRSSRTQCKVIKLEECKMLRFGYEYIFTQELNVYFHSFSQETKNRVSCVVSLKEHRCRWKESHALCLYLETGNSRPKLCISLIAWVSSQTGLSRGGGVKPQASLLCRHGSSPVTEEALADVLSNSSPDTRRKNLKSSSTSSYFPIKHPRFLACQTFQNFIISGSLRCKLTESI